MNRFLSFCGLFLPALAPTSAAAGTPLLEFGFNESGAVAQSTGALRVAAHGVSFGGTASDLHSSDGGGVSDQTGDRSFDNKESSQMGGSTSKPGAGGAMVVEAGSLQNLTSFTIEGWYKSEAGHPGNFARLLHSQRVAVFFEQNEQKGLTLSLRGSAVSSGDKSFIQARTWVFFAVTFDAAKTADNVQFFRGSVSEPVLPAGVGTIPKDGVGPSTGPIVIGNTDDCARPFAGSIDNLRVWGDEKSSAGSLSESHLEKIRQADLQNVRN